MSENTTTENVESTENAPAENAAPIIASLDAADPTTRFAVNLHNEAADAFNTIARANAGKGMTVDAAVAMLAESSDDPEVKKANDAIEALIAKRDARLRSAAEELVKNAGEPDVLAEKAAAKKVEAARTVLAMTPDGDKVEHFLTDLVKAPRKNASLNGSTPRNENAPHIRAWAKANGHEVSEKGRIADDVTAAWVAAGSPQVAATA